MTYLRDQSEAWPKSPKKYTTLCYEANYSESLAATFRASSLTTSIEKPLRKWYV